MNVEQIQNTQQQIARRNLLTGIGQMTASLQLSVCSADQSMRHVIVQMLVRVSHVTAVENERMIQQRAVAIVGLLQLVDEMGGHLHVVLIELGEVGDSRRIFAMVRAAMEAQSGHFAFRVGPVGQVAPEQQRADACDVGAERKGEQVELQLDVQIE